jgi:hypothetical protein
MSSILNRTNSFNSTITRTVKQKGLFLGSVFSKEELKIPKTASKLPPTPSAPTSKSPPINLQLTDVKASSEDNFDYNAHAKKFPFEEYM